MNNSRITYVKPKERFEQISNGIIEKFDVETIGIYCKLVRISSGKSMSISWLSKKLGINERRMRKTIVLLEEEGYITRKPIRDERCRIMGWNYELYAEPVRADKRTHPGKPTMSKTHLDGFPPCTKSTKVENVQDINIYNDIDINNKDLDINKEKVLSNDNTKNTPSDEEIYIEKMKLKFPRIMRMEQPLTMDQAKKLKERFGGDLLRKVMQDMENWNPLTKKNVSAYKTIIKWCEMELERV